MRLALQALFTTTEANEEGAARRALLERKLRTSERSAGFFQRLRAAADDPSLGAPEIFAEESFPDANVVAEYLDGQAPSELARAYEDACWDSPEMLAEIGCCCDILNNGALNSVVVPKNCRRRLYYIAWEEDAINVSSSEAATLTTNLASEDVSEVYVAPNEAKTSGATDLNEAENTETLPIARAKNKRGKAKKSESVRSTLEAERSWRRRGKRLSARLTLALGVLAVGCCGWQTLRERPSETLQLEPPTPKVEKTSDAVASLETPEAPLRPTTISSSNLDEIPAISLGEPLQTASNEVDEEFGNVAPLENEPPKLAVLPNLTDSEENWETATPSVERRRVGLGGDEPWQNRPPIQIPAQNNDVFTKAKLY